MSRSTRLPWSIDTSNRSTKPIHARRYRRMVHQRLTYYTRTSPDWETGPEFLHRYQVTCPYDLIDHRCNMEWVHDQRYLDKYRRK